MTPDLLAARSCLVAPSSLYAMNPCTEQAARAAIERSFVRPLILVEMPNGKQLPPPADDAECGSTTVKPTTARSAGAVLNIVSATRKTHDLRD